MENSIKNSEGVTSDKFVCEKCEKVYKTKGGLKNHTINEHQNGHKKVECDICHNFFKSPITLKVHIQSIHEKSSQLNPSVYLKKKIKAIHEKKRFHKCAYCGKGPSINYVRFLRGGFVKT